jgi:hypothetical protein
VALLLTEARAKELVSLPKRVLKDTEFSWQAALPPEGTPLPGKKVRVINPRVIKTRLLQVGGREVFLLSGNANGSHGFQLYWGDTVLVRINSTPDHTNPPGPFGEPGEEFKGPHVHYFVPGRGLRFAYGTTEFDQRDVDSGLSFFLKLCNVQSVPPLQEVMLLQ